MTQKYFQTLLIQIINDPKISEYDAIIIDEAHERSVQIDLLLSLLKNEDLTFSGLSFF